MNSFTTAEFRRLYFALELAVRQQTRQAYRLWRNQPDHPALCFARKGYYWSARINRGHRALERLHEGRMIWFWIGSHDAYERPLHG